MTGGLKMGLNVAAHTRYIFLGSAPPGLQAVSHKPPRTPNRWDDVTMFILSIQTSATSSLPTTVLGRSGKIITFQVTSKAC